MQGALPDGDSGEKKNGALLTLGGWKIALKEEGRGGCQGSQ